MAEETIALLLCNGSNQSQWRHIHLLKIELLAFPHSLLFSHWDQSTFEVTHWNLSMLTIWPWELSIKDISNREGANLKKLRMDKHNKIGSYEHTFLTGMVGLEVGLLSSSSWSVKNSQIFFSFFKKAWVLIVSVV